MAEKELFVDHERWYSLLEDDSGLILSAICSDLLEPDMGCVLWAACTQGVPHAPRY